MILIWYWHITEFESATWEDACQGFSGEFERLTHYLGLCQCLELLQKQLVIFVEWDSLQGDLYYDIR